MTVRRHPSHARPRPAESPHWLEIRRGRTRFARRMIRVERFLIGSGSTCHCQLGGEGIPMVHSLIVCRGSDARIEAFAPEPPLLINGTHHRTAALRPGDTIGIGPFEFAYRSLAPAPPPPPPPPPPSHDRLSGPHADFEQQPEDGTADASADVAIISLVDRLESDLRLVAEYESARRRGLARLLQAARAAGPAPDPDLPDVPLRRAA